MKNILSLILLVFFSSPNLQAQSGWSVIPSDYQFSMTITGDALIDCQYSISSNDEIAAFVGGDLRGVVNFGTTVNGKNLAYLIVYSNVSQGETVDFKLYDESTASYIDLLNELIFEENGSVGNGGQAYEFLNNYPPTALNALDVEIFDTSIAQDSVASFEVVDLDNSSYTYTLTNSASNDNDNFQIVNNQLLLVNDVDFVSQGSYNIEITATDNGGCSITETFTLDVINTNDAPYDIQFLDDDNAIKENEPVGTVVGDLIVLDSTLIDTHVFTLDSPSNYFSISGTQLLSEEIFDYEMQNEYVIYIRVTDASGNSYTEEFTIDILDVIELDDLKANNIITPNGDGFNDYFTIPNIELFSDFEFVVYNENGNRIFRRTSSAGYNNLWDGKSLDGQQLPSGTYYYTLFSPQTNEQFVGVINLLRN